MRLRVWGARGSVPAPGPETTRYGGNTPCVEVELSDGSLLVLDAGTGIRNLGLALPVSAPRIHILLTHLHLDHIQGLMFFAPLFNPAAEIMIWGPPAPDASLRDRVARYISAPLSPVEIRELPCDVSFQAAPSAEWTIGSATIRAGSVAHRGPTLGYRITEGDTSLCYIPDHEPALGGGTLDDQEPDWVSGHGLAEGASLLLHDGQYADAEYGAHVGWGHSRISDAVAFATMAQAHRVLLFHHDPLHPDDFLDELAEAAGSAWQARGRDPRDLGLAHEGQEVEVRAAPAAAGTRAGLAERR